MDDFELGHLEALRALAAEGTTARAAARLRLTQSAVSKRVATLEARVGAPLLVRRGRGVALTPTARELVERASPLLADLRDVVASAGARRDAPLVRVAASESLLSTWLPRALDRARRRVPGLRMELHAHRGPVLLERVRSGDYDLGICAAAGDTGDLVRRDLRDEGFVVVPSGLSPLPAGDGPVPVLAIEERSFTWQALALRVASRRRPTRPLLEVSGRLESFTALAQVAAAGFGHALVPRAVALALGLRGGTLVDVQGLSRTIAAFGRKRTLARPEVGRLVRELASACAREA